MESGSYATKKWGREDSFLAVMVVRAAASRSLGPSAMPRHEQHPRYTGTTFLNYSVAVSKLCGLTDVLSTDSGQNLFLLLAIKSLTVIPD